MVKIAHQGILLIRTSMNPGEKTIAAETADGSVPGTAQR